MREYCWTRCLIREEDEPPGPGWQYYGGCIRGTKEDHTASVWRLTRWAKEDGDTTRFEVTERTTKGKGWALQLLGTYQHKELTARERALALLNK